MADNCRRCKAPLPEGAKFCPACGTKQAVVRGRRQRGNGTGTAYKRGKTWTAVLIVGWKSARDKGGKPILDKHGEEIHIPIKRTKGGFATKREALEHIPVLRGGKPRKPVTLEQVYASWEQTRMQKLSDSAQFAYRKAHERIASIANIDMSALTLDDLQDVAREQGKTYYPASDIKKLLSHLYQRAMIDQVVTVNLAHFIELPVLVEDGVDPFTEGELAALWKEYEQGYSSTKYALLMIYTGMMPGELLICEKQMISWEKQEIVGCGLKTSTRRKNPLVFPDFIEPVLRDICALNPTKNKLVREPRKRFYQEFRAMITRTGCRQKLTPYSCRHTTATALALGNIAPSIIQRTMRHATFQSTERYISIDSSPVKTALNSLRKGDTDNVPTTR
jgi:integrase